MTNNIQGNSHLAISRFLNRNSTSKRMAWYIKNDEREEPKPRILYEARIPFRFDGEIKSLPDKQKLREFSTIKPALQQMLKELL